MKNHIKSMMPEGKNKWLLIKKEALKKHAEGECLTLEETACAIWDPNSGKKPLSALGVLKIERRALAKLKAAFAEYGIENLDDLFEPKGREVAQKN